MSARCCEVSGRWSRALRADGKNLNRDLYYHLAIVPLDLSLLWEWAGDIPLLLNDFYAQSARILGLIRNTLLCRTAKHLDRG